MASTTFTDNETVILAEWLNEVNNLVHTIFGNPTYAAQAISIDGSGNFTFSNNLTVQGAFTSLGIDDNATATALTINSSEEVGIGGSPIAGYNLNVSEPSATAKLVISSVATGDTELYFNNNGSNLQAIKSTRSGSDLQFYTANTLRMTLSGSGNVGIGMSPAYKQSIYESTSGSIYTQYANVTTGNTSSDGFLVGLDSGELATLWNLENTAMIFGTNNTERMRIDNSGNVLVGKTASSYGTAGVQLQANGEVWATRDGGATASFNRLTNDGTIVAFAQDGSTEGSVSISGTTTSYNTTSDYRLKENVVPLTNSINRVLELKPSRFNFKKHPDRTIDGFIAHEVQKVVPEAVTGEKDGEEFQQMDAAKLIPLLTASIQELISRIEYLESRVNYA